MTNKVLKTISEHKMTTECDVLGVGLSGGADSVCLAHVLIKNKDVLGIKSIKGIHIQVKTSYRVTLRPGLSIRSVWCMPRSWFLL